MKNKLSELNFIDVGQHFERFGRIHNTIINTTDKISSSKVILRVACFQFI